MGFLRKLLPLFVFASMLLAGACSEGAERVAADETAEQMEEAAMLGRNAAKEIVTRQWADSMQLQTAILHARSVSSKYDINKEKKCREAFDTAFFATIRTVRPDLARQLSGEAK